MATIEEQLRQACDDLPPAHTDSAAVLARLESVQPRRHNRGYVATIAGAAAGLVAASAVGIATFAGGSGNTSNGNLAPATTATASSSKNTVTNEQKSATVTEEPSASDYTEPPIPGVEISGGLLPHGPQLPAGLQYQPRTPQASTNSMRTANRRTVYFGMTMDRTQYGKVQEHPAMYGVVDGASNGLGDGDNKQRAASFAIVRFPSAAKALAAYQAAEKDPNAGTVFLDSISRTRVAWPGTDPQTHFLHKLGVPWTDYEAIAQVGPYLVSAGTSRFETPQTATQLLDYMVANLRGAGLVK